VIVEEVIGASVKCVVLLTKVRIMCAICLLAWGCAGVERETINGNGEGQARSPYVMDWEVEGRTGRLGPRAKGWTMDIIHVQAGTNPLFTET
jgi:uncharacterized protein YceK